MNTTGWQVAHGLLAGALSVIIFHVATGAGLAWWQAFGAVVLVGAVVGTLVGVVLRMRR